MSFYYYITLPAVIYVGEDILKTKLKIETTIAQNKYITKAYWARQKDLIIVTTQEIRPYSDKDPFLKELKKYSGSILLHTINSEQLENLKKQNLTSVFKGSHDHQVNPPKHNAPTRPKIKLVKQ
jgi:hypothetical protein